MAISKEKQTEKGIIKFKFFYIKTDKSEEFIDKLEQIMQRI
jgi:hypothetical protein